MILKIKSIAFILSSILLLACSDKKKEVSRHSVIKGEINDCEGCEIKLGFMSISPSHVQDIAKSKVQNGRFLFDQNLKQPGFYHLYYSDDKANASFGGIFYSASDTVNLLFDKNRKRPKFYDLPVGFSHLKYLEIKSTSPVQKEYDIYLTLADSLTFNHYKNLELVKTKFSQTFDSGNKALINQWGDSVRIFQSKILDYRLKAKELFVQRYPYSEVALYVIVAGDQSTQDAQFFRSYFASLPEERQNSYYGKILNDLIKKNGKRKKKNQDLIGDNISYLSGKTPDLVKLDAAAIFKKNKFTLVEFWASWCSPCRWEMPKYHELYKKYHTEGFDMIAVSIDENNKKWMKAIRQDSIYVHHISELKGNKGEDVKRFNVQLIPFNLLVNASGKIVAADLDSEELKSILKKEL